MCGPNNPISRLIVPAVIRVARANANQGAAGGSNGTQTQASFSGNRMAAQLYGSAPQGSSMLSNARTLRPTLLGS